MHGIGTLINVLAIVLGGLIGMIFKKKFHQNLQEALMKSMGLCVMFLGIGGALSQMLTIKDGALDTQGTIMMIMSFIIGTCIGEFLNIEDKFERFGAWLRKKTGNEKDSSFINAFVTASFTVCIGAMAIVGSLQDGLHGDPSILITKALLDFVIIAVMASTMGKGCMFAAIPVGILQWSITYLAVLLAPILTEAALSNVSLTGSILIFCVGVNLIEPKKFKVANMLPTIVIAILWGLF